GVSRQALHKIMAEKAPVSPEMALRLGKFFGDGPRIWLRLQEAVDLWDAEQKIGDQIKAIKKLDAA
ncbi:MAG: HigA family addiction module antitoxin, partial [Alphaproteobacteria bacterium]